MRLRPGWCGQPRDFPSKLTLADTSVLDPARTVTTDVNRVLWAEEIPQNVRVSGHVYDIDIDTGLVTTVVDAKARTGVRS